MTSNHFQPILLYCTSQHSATTSLFNGSTCISYRGSQADIGTCCKHKSLHINTILKKYSLGVLSRCAESRKRRSRYIGVSLRRGSRRRLIDRRKVGGDCWMTTVGWTPRRSLGILWGRHSPHSRRSMEDILGRFRRWADIFIADSGGLRQFLWFGIKIRNVRKIYHASIKYVYVD